MIVVPTRILLTLYHFKDIEISPFKMERIYYKYIHKMDMVFQGTHWAGMFLTLFKPKNGKPIPLLLKQ